MSGAEGEENASSVSKRRMSHRQRQRAKMAGGSAAEEAEEVPVEKVSELAREEEVESTANVATNPSSSSKKEGRKRTREMAEKHYDTDDDDDGEGDDASALPPSSVTPQKSKARPAAAAASPAAEGSSSKELAKSIPAVTDYKQLKLNPHIVSAIEEEFKFKELTAIQSRCIPAALQGRDLLAEAKTGAGKTLAFLIPIVEIIGRAGFRASNGTASIIIGPTRELCLQIEGVLLRLLKHFNGSITFLCCIGGQSRNQEGFKLANGVMIVVASPGRLLDHLKLTTDWHTKNLLLLAVDEADRVLDNGFEEDMREIVSLLPKKRQTFLFSATQTTRVEQLARISFHRSPVFISMKSKADKATVDTLEQGYVMCPSEKRLLVLYHFIKKNSKKKMIVFFSSRNSVSYHCELFNYIDVPCIAFHGKQKQHQRSATYMQFCNAPRGVLFTTDVAARGLDIPEVDWIVQFDPPDDPVKYVHRVGRTARAGRCGNALMFLLPQENLFLKYLYDDAKVNVNEYTFDLSKLNASVQEQLEQLVSSNYYLRTSARQAYEGYLLSYSSSQLKNAFNVQNLDLAAVARGFALSEPPPIKMDLSQSAANMSKKSRHEFRDMRKVKDVKRKTFNQKAVDQRHRNVSGMSRRPNDGFRTPLSSLPPNSAECHSNETLPRLKRQHLEVLEAPRLGDGAKRELLMPSTATSSSHHESFSSARPTLSRSGEGGESQRSPVVANVTQRPDSTQLGKSRGGASGGGSGGGVKRSRSGAVRSSKEEEERGDDLVDGTPPPPRRRDVVLLTSTPAFLRNKEEKGRLSSAKKSQAPAGGLMQGLSKVGLSVLRALSAHRPSNQPEGEEFSPFALSAIRPSGGPLLPSTARSASHWLPYMDTEPEPSDLVSTLSRGSSHGESVASFREEGEGVARAWGLSRSASPSIALPPSATNSVARGSVGARQIPLDPFSNRSTAIVEVAGSSGSSYSPRSIVLEDKKTCEVEDTIALSAIPLDAEERGIRQRLGRVREAPAPAVPTPAVGGLQSGRTSRQAKARHTGGRSLPEERYNAHQIVTPAPSARPSHPKNVQEVNRNAGTAHTGQRTSRADAPEPLWLKHVKRLARHATRLFTVTLVLGVLILHFASLVAPLVWLSSLDSSATFLLTYVNPVSDLQALYQVPPASLTAAQVQRLHHRVISEAVERLERATLHLKPTETTAHLRRVRYLKDMIHAYLAIQRNALLYARSRDQSPWRRHITYPWRDARDYGVLRFGWGPTLRALWPPTQIPRRWARRVWDAMLCAAQNDLVFCPSRTYMEEWMLHEAQELLYMDPNAGFESPKRRQFSAEWALRLKRDWNSEVYLETLLSFVRSVTVEGARDYNK